jgi:hypothetical protein
MRHSAGLLRLFASATLALVAAEPTRTAAQTGCETKRRSCIAECRAQYFTVDPKRDACVANCVAEANRCMREQAAQQGEATNPVFTRGISLTSHGPNGVVGLANLAGPSSLRCMTDDLAPRLASCHRAQLPDTLLPDGVEPTTGSRSRR